MTKIKKFWCFDFDGTVVDIEPRYTLIYMALMAEFGVKPIENYWSKRKTGLSEMDVLEMSKFPMSRIIEYDEKRQRLLESAQYLKFDKIFEEVVEIFSSLKSSNYEVWIVTHRSNHDSFVLQLEMLDIKRLISGWKCTKDKDNGLAMISDPLDAQKSKFQFFNSLNLEGQIIVVGDTQSDILAAKKAGAISIGVASGLQNYQLLSEVRPNYLFNSIAELSQLFEEGNLFK